MADVVHSACKLPRLPLLFSLTSPLFLFCFGANAACHLEYKRDLVNDSFGKYEYTRGNFSLLVFRDRPVLSKLQNGLPLWRLNLG